HSVLNAKQHEREAHVVAQAGRPGAVTVATNMAGRGVDILLGGNPEELADQELAAEARNRAEDPERFETLLARYREQCSAEGLEVREAGGLYVLGTERHESRRIDNQLRGRSGRQGDPGETRFYLSLEDDLMRLFATGLMSRVMDGAFPDDQPLESKMVTKSIERAQRTVEDRNFEIRKDVLKYDEVMNEQRKIIYRRRQQILDGEDLRDATIEAISATVNRSIDVACPGQYPEEWDLDELLRSLQLAYPTTLTRATLDTAEDIRALRELVVDEALERYAVKEESIGAESLREIERRVMLSIIDQHWREHLYEMDYLREGINLRAMGQRDPLTEWQREGFDMFEAMMGGIEDDFVRYVSHLEVVAEPEPEPVVRNLRYSAAEEPVTGSGALRAVAAAESAAEWGGGATTAVAERDDVASTPVRVDKTPGRNEPCSCGSGKKYKLCHGR
ncbi:MAG: preprotein translocase subunit SecA, partial [Actinobacteria bacterium]|nr:preprotein translocase subunit SecA [Actinomycetota bacterium]